MDSFFLIDKPAGITSFWVLSELRKKLGIKKIGHTGTLDPLATGCLLVATGNYTKLIPYFEKDTKEYECTILLDGVSDSYDIDTPVTHISDSQKKSFSKSISRENIQKILEKHFTGEIEQIPPAYSALKIGGKKAVDLVRAWREVIMKPRRTTIHEIEILDYSYPRLTLRCLVSVGTYIRSIAKDLWDILETGGYIETLRRTKIGKICLKEAITLEKFSSTSRLDEGYLFGKERFCVVEDLEILSRLSNGQRIKWDFPFPEWKDIFIMGSDMIQYIVRYQDGVLSSVRKIF